jgi:hypothetical protein
MAIVGDLRKVKPLLAGTVITIVLGATVAADILIDLILLQLYASEEFAEATTIATP